jgi:hypothetical protein
VGSDHAAPNRTYLSHVPALSFGGGCASVAAGGKFRVSFVTWNPQHHQRTRGWEAGDVLADERWGTSGPSASSVRVRKSADENGREYDGLGFRRRYNVAARGSLDEHHTASVPRRSAMACVVPILEGAEPRERIWALLAYAGGARKERRGGLNCVYGLGSQQPR